MLKNIRRIFGLILTLNALERILHAHIYYSPDFLSGYAVPVLVILMVSAILFSISSKKIWAFTTLLLSGIMAQGAPMLIYGLDMTSVPLLLYFCFDEDEGLKSPLLLIQVVVMYMMNGWNKMHDPILWTNGRMFEFVFFGSGILKLIPASFFSWAVISLQLSSILLVFRPLRRTMILALIFFHLMVITFIGLPYFQTVCILQLLILWKSAEKPEIFHILFPGTHGKLQIPVKE